MKTKLIPAALSLMAAVCSIGAGPASAAPQIVNALRSTATTYSFFTFDAGKLARDETIAQVQTDLQTQLTAQGITACYVTGDLNVNNLNCGNGAIRFGPDFFTYNLETSLALPATISLHKAIGVAQGVDFRVPAVAGTGEPARVIQFRFKQRIAQFGMQVDPLAAEGIQFIVNHQATPVVNLTPGIPNLVAVEDSHGFTDLTIVASGLTRAFVADMFSIVPLTSF